MRKLVLMILGWFLFHPIFAQPGLVFKTEALQNAGCSVYVIDADDSKVLFATPQVSLVPASVMKIVTTATALEILGADFVFHTQLGITGKVSTTTGALEGNLVLKGGCDPAFYSGYFSEHYKGTFEAWAQALSKAGVKSIKGDFIIDLSHFPGSSIPGGWLWEDIGNYYGAGISALTYSDNFYKIHFSSSAKPDIPVTISCIEPNIDSLVLINKVVSSDINGDLAVIYGAPGSYSQIVEGTIPKKRPDFIVKGAMPNPAKMAATDFLKVLKSNNIEILGKVRYINTPLIENVEQIADKSSPPLRDLIIPLNQESINLFAEHLLIEIGRAKRDSPLLVNCVTAITEFWKEKNIFTQGFYPTDGSGLSRSNGICPRTLAEILHFMYLSPNREVFFNSLPIAGKSGTLQFAFKDSKLENNLKAKTGSMSRVKSMAGIFTNQSGKKVIFAIILNNFEGTQASISRLIEEFLGNIYSLEPVSEKKQSLINYIPIF